MVRDSPRLAETYLGTHPTCWYVNLISFSYSPQKYAPLIFHRCFRKSRAHQKWSVLLNMHSSLTSESRFCLLGWGKYPAEEVNSRKQSIYILMFHTVLSCSFWHDLWSTLLQHSDIHTEYKARRKAQKSHSPDPTLRQDQPYMKPA